MPAEPEVYPLDVTKLNIADVIAYDQCERILGVTVAHVRYRLLLEGLRDWIMTDSEERGRPLSVATHENGLRVNTDAEASAYHARLAKVGERQIFRNLHRLRVTVRVGALSPDERKEHDRRVAVIASKVMRLKGRGRLQVEVPKEPEPKQIDDVKTS